MDKIGSVGIEKIGNTIEQSSKKKQPVRLINWFFTFNNYDEQNIKELIYRFNLICEKFIFQEEVGKCGTKHLQGNILLKKAMRWTEFKLSKNIHWEATRNVDDAFDYCMKAETRSGRQWILEPYYIETVSILKKWQFEIWNLIKVKPDGRKIRWYYDYKGGVGKSAFCKYMVIRNLAYVIQGGKLSDIMNIIFNSNMNENKMIIVDVPRNNGNKISYNAIECILNGMITNTKYETGFKVFNPPHVIVFANEKPEIEKLSKDRWLIKKLH